LKVSGETAATTFTMLYKNAQELLNSTLTTRG